MTGKYAEDHASALADVSDAGSAVTFALGNSSVSGSAIRVGGNSSRYLALGLELTQNPTLFFTPSTYGELPEAGYTVSWAGKTVTVKDVQPIAPDGVAIAARVICEL